MEEPMTHIVPREPTLNNEILDSQVHVYYGGVNDVTFTHTNWTMSLNLDTEANELIFDVEMASDKWLAIGFADNLINADVILWMTEKTTDNDADM